MEPHSRDSFITEWKWVEDGVALEQAPRVPATGEDAARPDAGQS